MTTTRRNLLGLAVLLAAMPGVPALAQQVDVQVTIRPWAPNVVIPQRRVVPARPQVGTVQITAVHADVRITDQVAVTTLDVHLRNPTGQRLEAEIVMPAPDGAVVRGFTFQGAGSEPSAQLLPKEEARRIYDSIVNQTRDPALLEFIGYNLIRSSVFPVEPGGTQQVRLTYEQVLPADGTRVDYVLPRSQAVDYHVPWQVKVSIESKQPISTVYSPSHRIETRAAGDNQLTATVPPDAQREPGSFRLSYLLQRDGVTASLFAYPDPSVGGGYFLLLAGAPLIKKPDGHPAIKREVTLVLDRSGSMNGEKLKQVREAALQILAGLEDGEAFNLIVYNEQVELFAEMPVIKSDQTVQSARNYLHGVKARGGTNIHDALLESLRQPPTDGMLPIVLFLTDGLPTIGQTSERAIRDVAEKANRFNRRVFTFGVGLDVNSPLLENIAYQTRAASTFVLPGEDVEVKVASVFKRLSGPVLADTKLAVLDLAGQPALGRVRDLLPVRLPDLFDGDQLVLLGQYVGEQPVQFELAGNYLGAHRSFRFDFDMTRATTRNAFVPRLWASRKIGVLIDAIRASGADVNPVNNTPNDPKLKELIDEIVRLSTEFGILTEYTAFLAREGTDLRDREGVERRVEMNLQSRAVRDRSGLGAINQDNNLAKQKAQAALNPGNKFLNDKMEEVAITSVQQVADRALYLKEGNWIDSKLVAKAVKADREVEFGSPEHIDLAYKLAARNRQAAVALSGEVLVEIDGENVLVKAPKQ